MISLKMINSLILVMESRCVFFEVRVEFLNIIQFKFVIQMIETKFFMDIIGVFQGTLFVLWIPQTCSCHSRLSAERCCCCYCWCSLRLGLPRQLLSKLIHQHYNSSRIVPAICDTHPKVRSGRVFYISFLHCIMFLSHYLSFSLFHFMLKYTKP